MPLDRSGDSYRPLRDSDMDLLLVQPDHKQVSPSASATRLLIAELGNLGERIVGKFRLRGVSIGMVRDGNVKVLVLELGGLVKRFRVSEFKELLGLRKK